MYHRLPVWVHELCLAVGDDVTLMGVVRETKHGGWELHCSEVEWLDFHDAMTVTRRANGPPEYDFMHMRAHKM